jgi:hypothetical protein
MTWAAVMPSVAALTLHSPSRRARRELSQSHSASVFSARKGRADELPRIGRTPTEPVLPIKVVAAPVVEAAPFGHPQLAFRAVRA